MNFFFLVHMNMQVKRGANDLVCICGNIHWRMQESRFQIRLKKKEAFPRIPKREKISNWNSYSIAGVCPKFSVE